MYRPSLPYLCLATCLWLVGLACQPVVAGQAKEPQRGRLLRESEEATSRLKAEEQKSLEQMMEAYRKMFRELGVDVEDDEIPELPEPFDFLGLDELKDRLEDSQEAAARIVVTETDIQGLDAYEAFDFAKAEELLRASIAEQPERAFPYFLHGCALFELDRFAEAADSFQEARRLEPESRLSLLLENLSRRFAGAPEFSPARLLEAYDYAYKDTVEALGWEEEKRETLVSLFTTPFTSDPIRERLGQLTVRVIEKRTLGVLQDYVNESDLERKITLAMLLGEDLGTLLITKLAQEHPEHTELQVFSFLLGYFGSASGACAERPESYVEDLAAAQALESENGALILLTIEGKDRDKPLSEEERSILRRAARSNDFRIYYHYKFDALMNEHSSRPGAYWTDWPANPPRSLVYSPLRSILYRAKNTAVRLLDEGEEEEAQAILSDIRALLAKVRDERPSPIPELFAESVMNRTLRDLQAYAARAKRPDLLERTLAERETLVRRYVIHSLAAQHIQALTKLPIRRIQKRAGKLNDNLELWEQRAWRILRLYAERHKVEATERLRKYGHLDIETGINEQIITLEMLRDPEGLEVLRPLADHPDPLRRHLARKAIKAIETAHQSDE